MADVEAIVLIAGEVRQVEKKRDFTDTVTGEVKLGKGRTADVLTYGGFVKLSIPAAFDSIELEQGDVLLVKAKVLPWVIAGGPKGDGTKWPDKHGTAFIFDGPLSAEELSAVMQTAKPLDAPAKH